MPTPSLRLPSGACAALAAGAILLTGCDRDQVSRSAPVPASPATPMPAPGGMPPAMGGEVAPPPAPSSPLRWTLPKGWTETPGSGMRFATLNPPGPGKIELSVVCLPGQAGGELANVNRWRGQIGLEPMDEKALGTSRQSVKSKAGAVAVFDFTSQGQAQTRMIVGSLTAKDGSTWFLKLVGDVAPVGKAKPDFMRYLETLRLD
ncbi:hypothetical protein [Mesoterricola silvestris]|uniref:Lipoprotein n=1 Tax=Mesoterricola silvestris TaxID=2927979 RepID=A0AA48GT36_9BACT|nr:hypothetical protein [Mesoterricola silvestris]BDU71251.1 hypothetical protein METEAL_04250 [Mesoterricola silvestris]